MNSSIELDSSLTEDTVVYKTLDFFAAAEIVTDHKLMFSRGDMFSDKNEGVDRLLGGLEFFKPHSGCGVGWSDKETARELHEHVKRSHYTSCWSRNPESVAMWSLYSPDYCSVRISTTISKLKLVVENLVTKYSFARLAESDIDKRVVASMSGRIASVTYASLMGILHQVSRRKKAYSRLTARYAQKNQPLPRFMDVDPRYWQREQQRKLIELRETCNLKDLSFQYEEEVRLSVRLGEEICLKRMFDEIAYLDPTHQYHSISTLSSWGLVKSASIPEREFVICPANLVETVALDPRCSPHKTSFIRDWFQNHNVPIVESNCFGYIPNSFSTYPEW